MQYCAFFSTRTLLCLPRDVSLYLVGSSSHVCLRFEMMTAVWPVCLRFQKALPTGKLDCIL